MQTSPRLLPSQLLPPSLAVIHCFHPLPPAIFVSQESRQVSPFSPCPKTCSLRVPSFAGSQFLDRSEQRPCWLGSWRSFLSSTWWEGSVSPCRVNTPSPPAHRAGPGGSPGPSCMALTALTQLSFPHGVAAPRLEHQLHEAQTVSVSAISVSPAPRARSAT